MQMIQENPADSMDTLSAGFFVSFLEDSFSYSILRGIVHLFCICYDNQAKCSGKNRLRFVRRKRRRRDVTKEIHSVT